MYVVRNRKTGEYITHYGGGTSDLVKARKFTSAGHPKTSPYIRPDKFDVPKAPPYPKEWDYYPRTSEIEAIRAKFRGEQREHHQECLRLHRIAWDQKYEIVKVTVSVEVKTS